jgi:chlorophyllide a reductase subunit Y
MDTMRRFFDGVGEGFSSGVWEDVPEDKPAFRQRQRRMLEKLRAKSQNTQDLG